MAKISIRKPYHCPLTESVSLSISLEESIADAALEPIRKLLKSNESDVILVTRSILLGERLMWRPERRRTADHTDLRYPSDLSDANG